MRMTNKLLKTFLGSVMVVAPLATAISCSTATELSDADQELISTATTSTALAILENKWLEQVIKEEITDISVESLNDQWGEGASLPLEEIVEETIMFHLSSKMSPDPSYLKSIANELLKKVGSDGNAKYNTTILDENANKDYTVLYNLEYLGFKKPYIYGLNDAALKDMNSTFTYTTRGGAVKSMTKKRAIINILMSEVTLGFRTEIYKYILVNEYLTMTFDEWSKLYKEKANNLSDVEKIIDKSANFELVRTLLEKKFFLKWEVDLDTNKSAPYVGEENIKIDGDDKTATLTALREFMEGDGGATDLTTGYADNVLSQTRYTTKTKKLGTSTLDFSHNENSTNSYISRIDDLAGYQGITSLSSVGKGKLNFSKKGLEAAKDSDYWFGFYQYNGSESNIVNNDIKYFGSESASEVKMTFVMGLMPMYVANTNTNENDLSNEKLTLDGTYFSADNKIQALTRMLYSQDSSIYNQAFDWFTKKEDDGGKEVLLKVYNKTIREKYQDMNINYIEYDEKKYQ